MSTPTPRTDRAWNVNGGDNAEAAWAFARTLERELATEREKVRALTAILESICEEWGRNHDANPIGAGQKMETLASKALEDMEEAQ